MSIHLFEPAPAPVPTARKEFGDGPFGRAATLVYWHIVVGLLMLALMIPTLLVFLTLDRSAGNIPFFALALIPVAPVCTAAMSALARRGHESERAPARTYLNALRSDALDVLRIWAPVLAILAVIATVLMHGAAAEISAGHAVVLFVIAALITIAAVHAMVISTFFRFRLVDALRLGVVYLARRPLSTLGVISLGVLAATVVVLSSELVLALLLVVWAPMMLRVERPLLRDVAQAFTAAAAEEGIR